MKILLTGANGQVGNAIRKALEKKSCEFLALPHYQLDITNKHSIEKILFDYHPDLVINTAAYTAVDQAESDQDNAYAVNSSGVANLADTCLTTGAAIIHLSTDYVFSGKQTTPYREEDAPAPINIYGKSKLAGEQQLANIPKHLILRTAWVFSEHPNNFINRLIRLGQIHSRLDIVDDQFGSPTYAGDIAVACINIIDTWKARGNLPWGTYHYAGQPCVSRFELARYLFNRIEQLGIYDHPAPELNPVASKNFITSATRPANTSLCCNKIQQELEIMPPSWQNAIDYLLSQL